MLNKPSMIRKMYEALPAEAGGAPPATTPEPLSIAAQMAKGGVKRTGDAEPAPQQRPAIPAPTPQKTETTPPAPTPGETPKPASPAPEPPKSEAKPAPSPATPPKTETPPVDKPWQEVLKSQKPAEVFKELGFDDKQVKLLQTIKDDPKMAKFFDHWINKGNVTDYLKAVSVDFTKMSPEDVMKHSLRERNPEMSTEDFNELYDMKVIERYKLDPDRFTEAEVKRGRIELAADVKAEREALVRQQQDFLLSTAPDQVPDTSAADAEAAGKQASEAYQKHMSEDAFVKNVISTKTIKFGEGEDAFNYGIDPDALTNILYDPKEWAKAMFKSVPDENGKGEFIPDSRKQLIVSAVVKDTDGFINALAAHYQSIGAKKALAEIENPSTPGATPSKTDATPATPAEAMAKSGRIVTGGQ